MSTNAPEVSSTYDNFAAKAALLVVGFVWGGNFAATKFALEAFSPWTFRTVSYTAGAVLLMLVAILAGASLRVDRASDRLHLAISGLFGCAGFGALSAIAVLHTSTGRAAICAYTMPIWAVLLSRVVLKEPLTVSRVASLTLCCAGLSILLWPLIRADVSLGVLAAIGAAVSWAIAVVYLKWARVTAHPFAMAVWQLLAGAIASTIGALFESHAAWTPMGTLPMLGLGYGVIVGTAIAYPLWFRTLQRLPASTAGLGTLLVPVFGVAISTLLLNEQPTQADWFGFALILSAAVVALSPEPRALAEHRRN